MDLLGLVKTILEGDWSKDQPIITPVTDDCNGNTYTVSACGLIPAGVVKRADLDELGGLYMFYNNNGNSVFASHSVERLLEIIKGHNANAQQRLKSLITISADFVVPDREYCPIVDDPKLKSILNRNIVEAFYAVLTESTPQVDLILNEIRQELNFKKNKSDAYQIDYVCHWGDNADIILYAITNARGVTAYNVSCGFKRLSQVPFELVHFTGLVQVIVESLVSLAESNLVMTETLLVLTAVNKSSRGECNGYTLLGTDTNINKTDLLYKVILLEEDKHCNKVYFEAEQIGIERSSSGKVTPNFNVTLSRFVKGYLTLKHLADDEQDTYFGCDLQIPKGSSPLWLTVVTAFN